MRENCRKDKALESKWKTWATFLSLSWTQGRKSRCASQYFEENLLSISSLPVKKDVPRKDRLKIVFKVCFFKLSWSFITEILASPPALLSFTQNLMMISFLTEISKDSASYKYVFYIKLGYFQKITSTEILVVLFPIEKKTNTNIAKTHRNRKNLFKCLFHKWKLNPEAMYKKQMELEMNNALRSAKVTFMEAYASFMISHSMQSI